ncbi:Ribose-phosphate pyrophosphokinase [Candidatus Hodgkinia cicadicola]|nr:Ribose-phosphate pyrophosphokinase [Candidatus Hodgkinia cicadicola]
MKIYTTTQSTLAHQIRAYFNITNLNIKLTKFPDGEILVSLPETHAWETVILIQALYKPVNDAIIQTLFALEAIKLACVSKTILVITYLGYARQDRLTCENSLISCSVVCKLLCINAPTIIYLLEPHSAQTVGFFSVPCLSFGLVAAMCEHISRTQLLSSIVIVALDSGAMQRALNVSKALGVGIICGYKRREKNQVEVTFQDEPLFKGKTGIIIDDIIDTGKSVKDAIFKLTTKLLLARVITYCVHGVLSYGQLANVEVHVSNSIPGKNYTINVAYGISRQIKRALVHSAHSKQV